MMKTIKYSMALLIVLGTMMMSCTKEDDAAGDDQPRSKTVTLTATISLDGNTTRALTSAGVKTFAEGDQIAVVYKDGDEKTKVAISSPLPVGTYGKSATFTVTLESPKASSAVRYIYPAAMVKATIAEDAGTDDDNTVNYAALSSQDGTLATLGKNYDLCIYDGSLTADAKLPDNVKLTNKLAICEFAIKNGGSDITSSITNLTITDGTNLYVVTRKAVAGPIYVAIQPVSSKTFTFYAASETTGYTKSVSGQTLSLNNLYPINVTMELCDMEQAMQATPFSIEAITDGKVIVTRPQTGMQYTKNGSAKMTVPSGEISVATGDVLQFYGAGTSITGYGYSSATANQATQIYDGTANYFAYGNMMSLLDEKGFVTNNILPAYTDYNYTFAFFFYGNTHLFSHSDKTLELPATTLREGCYYNMFYGCTNLTKAPVLPAATLVDKCYKEMFQNCSSLNYVKCLATNPGTSSQSYTKDWLSSVSSSGTFVKKSSVTTWSEGASGIPSGWTVNNE